MHHNALHYTTVHQSPSDSHPPPKEVDRWKTLAWLSNAVGWLEDHHQALGHIASLDEDPKDSMSMASGASGSHWQGVTMS